MHTLLENPSKRLQVYNTIVSEYCRSSLTAISALVWTTMLFQKTFQNMQNLSFSVYTTVNILAE